MQQQTTSEEINPVDRAQEEVYNFGDCLVKAAEESPNKIAFVFQEWNPPRKKQISYRNLHLRALQLSRDLKQRVVVGDRALLVYPPGLDYIIGFMGCLYAGVIAVPVYPPATASVAQKLRAIIDDCSPTIILTDRATISLLKQLKRVQSAASIPVAGRAVSSLVGMSSQDLHAISDSLALGLPFLATDELQPQQEHEPENLKDQTIARSHPDTPAFLQYTSGSTGQPKGVMVSHGNLRHSSAPYQTHFSLAGKRMAFWLPPYHDLGLIGGILTPIFFQCETLLFSPLDFLGDPLRWLLALSEFRAQISAAPNFAYGLAAKRFDEKRLAGLDLSCVELLLVGAEPVRLSTMRHFVQTFAKFGLSEAQIAPGYGIAEGTLIITGRKRTEPFLALNVLKTAYAHGHVVRAGVSEEGIPAVGCGSAFEGHEVVVVDPETCQPLPDRRVGEIWIRSRSVARGYWRQPELTARTFEAVTAYGQGPFLRTGDLGFFYEEQLFISGRLKDVIIVAGRKYYPQDVEVVVDQSSDLIRPGCSIAISVESGDTEALVLLVELREASGSSPEELDQIAQKVVRNVLETCQLMPIEVLLLRAKALDKTTSGKVRRQPNKERFLRDRFASSALFSWRAPANPSASNGSPRVCVIGGGPAGMMAALELRDKGYDKVTVLEAQRDMGGKSLGVLNEETGRYAFHGIYALNTQAYRNMLQLARRYSVDLIDPLLPKNHIRSQEAEQKELVAFIDRYELFKKTVLEDYGHILAPNYCGDFGDLWMPFSAWLAKHGWDFDVGRDFGLALVAPGYGYDLPAYYGLLGTVTISIDNWRLVSEDGFLRLWQTIARDLNCVRCGTAVRKVTRRDGRIFVETNREGECLEFDRLVVACDLQDAGKFLDATEEEAELFAGLEYSDYRVAIAQIKAADVANIRSLSENQQPGRYGHPVLLSAYEKEQETYQVLYYGTEDSQQQLELIRAELSASWVCEIKRWRYFPHFGPEALRRGSLSRLRRLQGQRGTFFVSSALMFENTEFSVTYAKFLVGTQFPEFLPEQKIVSQLAGKAVASATIAAQRKEVKRECYFHATFEVGEDVPKELQVGVFSRPGARYDGLIHLSDRGDEIKPKTAPKELDATGFALKLPELGQDFLFLSAPYFPFATAEEFLRYTRSNNDPEAFFFDRPDRLQLMRDAAQPMPDALEIAYFGVTPYQLGASESERVVKYALFPRFDSRSLPRAEELDPDGWHEAVARRLVLSGIQFDFCIQIRSDPSSEPLDDATVVWTKAPYLKLGRVSVQPQRTFSPEKKIDFSPWNCLPEHTPLGSMNRARRRVYSALQDHRNHKPNSQGSEGKDGGSSGKSPEEVAARVLTKEQSLSVLRRTLAEHLLVAEESIRSGSLSEIGLSSVMVVGVHNALLQQLGFDFSLSLMFEAADLDGLAERIALLSLEHSQSSGDQDEEEARKRRRATADADIISFSAGRDRDSKPPLFLVHDISLFAIHYRRLLPALAQFSVHGVNYPNIMQGEAVSYSSFEALAADYIRRIKTIAPVGPYRLGGWSLGGNISLEMTRQLQAAGEEVELLLFLDTRYQEHPDLIESRFFELFLLELIRRVSPEYSTRSRSISRRVEQSFRTFNIFQQHYRARTIARVPRMIFVRCRGSLVFLANQEAADIHWSQYDLLNGLRYFLPDDQPIHLGDIRCEHVDLMKDEQKDELIQLLSALLQQDEGEAYQVSRHADYLALTEASAYQALLLRAETENVFPASRPVDRAGKGPKYELIHTVIVYQSISPVAWRAGHQPSVLRVLGEARVDFSFALSILQIFAEVSPSFAATDALDLARRLLVLRLISSESTALVAAWVLDETILSVLLLLAQQLNASAVSYLHIALSRKDPAQISRVFWSALALGLCLAVPMIVYGCLATQIGRGIGVESAVVDAWRALAFAHILGCLPSLASFSLEMFCRTCFLRRLPAAASLAEAIGTLVPVLLFKYEGVLDGLSLGLSLSIGSWCKLLFYLLHLVLVQREAHLLRWQWPGQALVSGNLMAQIVRDAHALLLSSLCVFSNYIEMACLIASSSGALSLTGYAVGRSCFELVNLTNSIVAGSSGLLTGRFVYANQFRNAFHTSLLGLAAALILAGCTSIALGSVPASSLVRLFIDTAQIPSSVFDYFCEEVQKNAFYFIGLGLVNALRVPLLAYLAQSFAFRDIQWTSCLCALVLANGVMLAVYFGHDRSDTEALVCAVFAASGLSAVILLWRWLGVSDFQCAHELTVASSLALPPLCSSQSPRLATTTADEEELDRA